MRIFFIFVTLFILQIKTEDLDRCELSEWSDWSGCSSVCGVSTRIRTRDCVCKDNKDCDDNTEEIEYCPQSCTRDITYWKSFFSEGKMEIPWPISESTKFSCKGREIEQLSKSNWLEIVQSDDADTTWAILAQQFIVATLNTEAGVEPPRGINSAMRIANDLLTICDGFNEKEERMAKNIASDLSDFNTGKIGEGKCEDGVCCFNVWSAWSECSETCGGGSRQRTEQCICPFGSEKEHCPKKAKVHIESCNTQTCCSWNQNWEEWTQCTRVCGGGTKTRNPSGCECPHGWSGEPDCVKPAADTVDCNSHRCCFWGEWADWTPCSSAPCGGIRRRAQKCVCSEYAPHGDTCEGAAESHTEDCPNKSDCCKFGEWSEWSQCTDSCHGGVQTRERHCLCLNTVVPREYCNQTNETITEDRKNCGPGICSKKAEFWTKSEQISEDSDSEERFECMTQNTLNRPVNKTWTEILTMETDEEDPWLLAAKEWIVANKNRKEGVSAPKEIDFYVKEIKKLLETCDRWTINQVSMAEEITSILKAYNEGKIMGIGISTTDVEGIGFSHTQVNNSQVGEELTIEDNNYIYYITIIPSTIMLLIAITVIVVVIRKEKPVKKIVPQTPKQQPRRDSDQESEMSESSEDPNADSLEL